MISFWVLFWIIWVVCAIVAHGFNFAYWQGKFPMLAREHYWNDLIFSIIWCSFGIVALNNLLIFQICGKRVFNYGFKLW